MLYCYLKKPPRPARHPALFISITCFTAGVVFLLNAFWPILAYEIKSQNFSRPLLLPVEVKGDSDTVVDYSQPKAWFPLSRELPASSSNISRYHLSIPELNIKNALVKMEDKDLMTGLVHYPGTALPGQYGNTVIFGHSVLPQFFNPKDYKTIFSTLPTLNERDEIFLDFDGIVYRYKIYKMVEVTPEDVSVLEQQYDNQYLSLITCVPPGTYLRRLVVRARLVN